MLSIVRIGRRGTLPCVDAAQAAAWLERWPDLELLPLLLHVRFTAPGHLCKVRQKSGGYIYIYILYIFFNHVSCVLLFPIFFKLFMLLIVRILHLARPLSGSSAAVSQMLIEAICFGRESFDISVICESKGLASHRFQVCFSMSLGPLDEMELVHHGYLVTNEFLVWPFSFG